MKFYHANPSPKKYEIMCNICEEIDNRAEYTPKSYVKKNWNYILDNGIYTDSFSPEAWKQFLIKVGEGIYREPDFIVLPDKMNDPTRTFCRSQAYYNLPKDLGISYYYVIQPTRDNYKTYIDHAKELKADGVFIGGNNKWSLLDIPEIMDLAHNNGLKVHIGKPKKLYQAYKVGADSIDSSSITRNRSYDRLRNLENKIREQKELGEFT